MPRSNKTRALIDPLAKTRLLQPGQCMAQNQSKPSLNTLRMSCHRGRSQCLPSLNTLVMSPRSVAMLPSLHFACHVTEVGRNAANLEYSVMSPRLVAMLPSLHRMSCHRGRSQCYHPSIRTKAYDARLTSGRVSRLRGWLHLTIIFNIFNRYYTNSSNKSSLHIQPKNKFYYHQKLQKHC